MADAITGLYYITHINNLASILKYGILSHAAIQARKIPYTPIYDEQIVQHRQGRITLENKNLWQYANFFFQPRNAMLYRVVREKSVNDIIIVKLKMSLLNEKYGVLLSDGNAAHSLSQITRYDKKTVKEISKSLHHEYWSDVDGTKRKMMAECLVPDSVAPEWIECIYVGKHNGVAEHAREIIAKAGKDVHVVPEPPMFFLPRKQSVLDRKLFLAEGDMFFSNMQTLTISVNTKGIMGKGLASRAKYQFPDVYVTYQDLCKNRSLRVGKPALVTRELSLAQELSENPSEADQRQATWFLLFATKQNWRENSKIEYIVDGLKWLEDNYKRLNIQSLALPALGCGLGNLTWEEVGPIICSTVSRFDIPVCVYLPAEKIPEDKYLTREYLVR